MEILVRCLVVYVFQMKSTNRSKERKGPGREFSAIIHNRRGVVTICGIMHWIFLGVVCLTLNCVLAEYNIKTTDYCEASSMIRSKAGCEAALLALENSPVGSTIKRFKATKVGYMARNITSPPGCFYRNSGEEVWYNHNPEVSTPGTGLGPALPIARTGVICSVSDPTHVDLCYSECPVLNQKNGIGLHDILKSTPCQTLPIGVGFFLMPFVLN